MNSTSFLTELHATVVDLRTTAQTHFAALDLSLLNQRPAPASWSILECLEHLNRYSRYYNPAFAKALAQAGPAATTAPVAYTWLGQKSVALVHPTNAKKQPTLKRMNPLGSRLSTETLLEFDRHQAYLLTLLAQAHAADLNRKSIQIEFFRLLKLRLGEALEFVVRHQQRHVQQALRVQATVELELAC